MLGLLMFSLLNAVRITADGWRSNASICDDRLVCVGLIDGVWQLFVKKEGVKDFQQMTFTELDKRNPSWSPGNPSRICFEWKHFLWVLDVEHPEEVYCLEAPYGSGEPRWMDEENISFTQYHDVLSDHTAICSVNIQSGNRREWIDHPYLDREADPGPIPGSWLWVSGAEMHGYEIFVLRNEEEGEFAITSDKENDFHPRWSPDGSRVVYQTYDHRNADIVLRPILSIDEIRIGDTLSYEGDPCWSSDGNHVYFVTDRDKTFRIYRSDDRGRNLEAVSPGNLNMMEPDVWKRNQ